MSLSQDSKIREAIPLVNEIQDFFARNGKAIAFDLPQIVVIGSQSAGKSSVLENFVGRQFLPRGNGIVTRRPLVLQLVKINEDLEEYGVFTHKEAFPFDNYEDICREIEKETDRITGANKGISNVPINLKIFSPNVLNLTLVDLPGLTRNPVGDQPADIEQQITQMIMSFIEKENSLILAVTPANVDMATSDAMNLARKVDPSGARTIGVLTKLDLMDKGTNARETLENKNFSLKRGYIGVMNRCQMDIEQQKTIDDAIASEKAFLQGHPAYKHMASRHGTPYLQKYLNSQLTEHIRNTLPDLRLKIQEMVGNLSDELKSFHEKPKDSRAFNKLILDMANDVTQRFQRQMGDVSSRYGNVKMDELCCGAQIKNMFEKEFSKDISRNSVINEVQFRHEILVMLQNTNGVRAGFFPSAKAFEEVVKHQVERLSEPCQASVKRVFNKIAETIRSLFSKMSQFPNMERYACKKALECLEENRLNANAQIDLLLHLEMSYMDTKHRNLHKRPTKSDHDEAILGEGHIHFKIADGDHIFTDKNVKLTSSKLLIDNWEPIILSEASVRVIEKKDGMKKVQLWKGGRSNTVDLNGQIQFQLNQEDTNRWIAAFCGLGFYPPLFEEPEHGENENTHTLTMAEPSVVSQVEYVHELVNNYMEIVVKTMRSVVPKIVVAMIIDKQIDFFRGSLPVELIASGDKLWEEAPNVAQEREEKLESLEMCRNVLDVFEKIESL